MTTTVKALTQRDFIEALRESDLELRVCTATVHAWIKRGMPTVPGKKKPRFHLPSCKAWLLAARDAEPVVQDARDKVFARMMRKGA